MRASFIRALSLIGLLGCGLLGCESPMVGACEPECGAGEACLRGVCVAECGANVASLDQALGAELVPVAAFCRTANAFAVRESGAGVSVWDVRASTEGTTTSFVLSRWELDPSVSTPAATEVATTRHDTGSDEVMTFAGGYLALDPSAQRAVFGYTTSAEDFAGAIIHVALDGGAVTEVPAPGNFDAAWIDGTHVVVNGFGLGDVASGQGVYAADLSAAPRAIHIGTNMGEYSGSVAASPSYVIAAGVEDGTFAPHVYFLAQEPLEAALTSETAADLASDASELLGPEDAALASTFSIVRDRLVTAPFGGPITSYAIALSQDPPALSDPRVLATSDVFSDVLPGGEGRLLLAHGAGLLLVEE